MQVEKIMGVLFASRIVKRQGKDVIRTMQKNIMERPFPAFISKPLLLSFCNDQACFFFFSYSTIKWMDILSVE